MSVENRLIRAAYTIILRNANKQSQQTCEMHGASLWTLRMTSPAYMSPQRDISKSAISVCSPVVNDGIKEL